MADIRSKIRGLYSLEQIASGDTFVHKVHPLAKIITAFVFIICVMSMGRLTITALIPFFAYPLIMLSLLDVPFGMFVKRTMLALPFVVFAGISNVIFDRQIVAVIGTVPVTAGVISFISLLLRTFLCVSSVLILIASTPFSQISACLRMLHVPQIFVTLLEMTYRYIGVLAEEASTMITAFRLRSGGRKWPDVKEFSVFIGQLLLRSMDRAKRIYHAMQCRLYGVSENSYGMKPKAWNLKDTFYLVCVSGIIILFRVVNISEWIGGLFI